MAAMKDLKIQFEIEPIVKLTCLAFTCGNNDHGTCNLKKIAINDAASCKNYFDKRK